MRQLQGPYQYGRIKATIDVTKKVEDMNQKVTGWVYGITKQKYDAMVKKPEDLLVPQKSP